MLHGPLNVKMYGTGCSKKAALKRTASNNITLFHYTYNVTYSFGQT